MQMEQQQQQKLPLPAPGKRSSLGRRKVEIKKIKEKKSLDVTFSKRRKGLFKKATELAVLCGTPIAAIVFSPGGRAYSFGHPSADAVIDCYLRGRPCQVPLPVMINSSSSSSSDGVDAQLLTVQEQNEELKQLRPLLDLPVDGLDLGDLEQFLVLLQSIRAEKLQKIQALQQQLKHGSS